MNVKTAEKTGPLEIRQSLGVTPEEIFPHVKPMPKKTPVARLKIINGRPYYYQIENIWDRKAQRCRQKSKYLGKELPRGYRLIK